MHIDRCVAVRDWDDEIELAVDLHNATTFLRSEIPNVGIDEVIPADADQISRLFTSKALLADALDRAVRQQIRTERGRIWIDDAIAEDRVSFKLRFVGIRQRLAFEQRHDHRDVHVRFRRSHSARQRRDIDHRLAFQAERNTGFRQERRRDIERRIRVPYDVRAEPV